MYFVKCLAIIASVGAALIAGSVWLILSFPAQDAPSEIVRAAPNGSSAMPVRFDKAVNLTNNTQDSVYGQVVASEKIVYVVWQDSVPADLTGGQYESRNYDIYMAKSDDRGRTFTTYVNLSNNPGFSEHPQAAASDDIFYAVWADNTQGNKEVLFARSIDGGLNFEVETNLSNSPGDSFNQEIAVHRDSVYVVWLEEGNGKGQVMLRASTDAGKTFDSAIVITDSAGLTTLPKVAADSRGVHIAWSVLDNDERGLYYTRMNGSKGFGDVAKLADGNEFGEPQIVATNSTVYVVAGGQDRLEVDGLFLAKSMDGGASFTTEVIDFNGTFVNPLNVEAAVDDDSILYVAGQVLFSGDEEIFLLPLQVRANATDALGFVDLSNNEKVSECPSIAISRDRVFVVWEDLSPGNHEILYARGEKI